MHDPTMINPIIHQRNPVILDIGRKARMSKHCSIVPTGLNLFFFRDIPGTACRAILIAPLSGRIAHAVGQRSGSDKSRPASRRDALKIARHEVPGTNIAQNLASPSAIRKAARHRVSGDQCISPSSVPEGRSENSRHAVPGNESIERNKSRRDD